MYLFVVIFALVSLLQDQNVKTVISKHYNQTWKRFYKRVEKESKAVDNIEEREESDLAFFGKD